MRENGAILFNLRFFVRREGTARPPRRDRKRKATVTSGDLGTILILTSTIMPCPPRDTEAEDARDKKREEYVSNEQFARLDRETGVDRAT